MLGELRRSIRSGQWPPGTPIRQEALAIELGVSRVPVREALKILEGEGQVTYAPHKGYVVAEFDTTELQEIYRIRDVLEDEAVRQAVPRLTEEDFERMRSAMIAMEKTDSADVNGLTEHNRRFHQALFEAADMPRLLNFIRILRDWSDAYRAMVYNDPELLSETWDEHRAIFEACREKDTATVVHLLGAHRSRTVRGLTSNTDAPTA